MNRLQEKYNKEIAPVLQKEFDIKNVMATPKVTQINLNIGLGKYLKNSSMLETIKKDLTVIAGQAPVETKARKSIAGFKIREGQVIGMTVTLRGQRMYDFLDKLISVSLPRTKDFRGISRKGFDGRGNFNLGIKEQIIFPEITNEVMDNIFNLQVTIVTTAQNDDQGYMLLKQMNFPFKD
ncbi:MAG: 50S ribosomal protein L5 [Candidatus Doudnabacteria bacterium]